MFIVCFAFHRWVDGTVLHLPHRKTMHRHRLEYIIIVDCSFHKPQNFMPNIRAYGIIYYVVRREKKTLTKSTRQRYSRDAVNSMSALSQSVLGCVFARVRQYWKKNRFPSFSEVFLSYSLCCCSNAMRMHALYIQTKRMHFNNVVIR